MLSANVLVLLATVFMGWYRHQTALREERRWRQKRPNVKIEYAASFR